MKYFNKTTLDPISINVRTNIFWGWTIPLRKKDMKLSGFFFSKTKTLLPRNNKKDITAKYGYNCHVCGPWLDLCLERFACACSAYRTIISWGWLCCYHKSFSARLFCLEVGGLPVAFFYYSGNSNYQLHFPLPAFFLSDTETSHSNVTMRVISFDLSHTLTAKPAARTLIQCTSCNGFPKTGSKQAETMLSFLESSKNISNWLFYLLPASHWTKKKAGLP